MCERKVAYIYFFGEKANIPYVTTSIKNQVKHSFFFFFSFFFFGLINWALTSIVFMSVNIKFSNMVCINDSLWSTC